MDRRNQQQQQQNTNIKIDINNQANQSTTNKPMSVTFVEPSISRRVPHQLSTDNNNNNNSSSSPSASTINRRSIRRSQTFAYLPPATRRLTRNSTAGLISAITNEPPLSPTKGPPRRARTGLTHFEPRPATNGLIISGYTCIGKSSLQRRLSLRNAHRVIDLDSSNYPKGPGFVDEYLAGIRAAASERSIVLISTHDGVAQRLREEGYYVALVYPEGSDNNKKEWLRRLEKREKGGRDSPLYKLLDEKWEVWDKHMRRVRVSKKVELSNKGYLLPEFNDIYKDYFEQVVIGRR